jgi:hypothetical protein
MKTPPYYLKLRTTNNKHCVLEIQELKILTDHHFGTLATKHIPWQGPYNLITPNENDYNYYNHLKYNTPFKQIQIGKYTSWETPELATYNIYTTLLEELENYLPYYQSNKLYVSPIWKQIHH